MQESTAYKVPVDYHIVLCICAYLVVLGLVLASPVQIAKGYYKILTSRSVLVTDYIALAGVGATLVNAASTGLFYLILLIAYKTQPSGRIILALFLTIGFSLFGKNMCNSLPIFFGVWLHAKAVKAKFSGFLVHAMLGGTVSPLVSEIAFLDKSISPVKILAACGVGLFVGFIFPVIMEAAKRMHRGYCLYNGGTAGGFIATFFVGILYAVGIDVRPENFWDSGHTVFLAFFAYILAAALIIYGIFKDRPTEAFRKFRQLLKEKDVNDNDYLIKYEATCYINIGLMCMLSTSLMLLMKIPINGPVLGGIFTVTGFAAAGKHLKNTIPVLLGSIAGAYFNFIDPNASVNSLAILFSTGLAPISGKHGWYWGFAAGFIHVLVAVIIGNLNGGLNLYNNGFAGSFVAITVVPLIVFLKELFIKPKNQ